MMYLAAVPLEVSLVAKVTAPRSHHGRLNRAKSLVGVGGGDGDTHSNLSPISDKLHDHHVSTFWCPFL